MQVIAQELGVGHHQVTAAITLLDEGSTVPFIARYRKEVTGNLDDTHLRSLEERLLYLRELEDRRAAILASIEEQGKLTDELRGAIEGPDASNHSKISICPISPSAARARKLPAKRGWSFWLTRCLPIRRSTSKEAAKL